MVLGAQKRIYGIGEKAKAPIQVKIFIFLYVDYKNKGLDALV